MYKLLIADDELMICALIKRLVHWEALPVECVGVASHGTECLAMIERLKPDIVITDIRMPGLSGLEIIDACLQARCDIRFIIISGYAQFDYAHQAIKYGVSDFLIKPIQEDELNASLARVVGNLQGGAVADTLKYPDPNLRASLLLHLAMGGFSEETFPDIASVNRLYGYGFEEGAFLPVSVALDSTESPDSYNQNILHNIEKILREEIVPRSVDNGLLIKDNQVLALFQIPEDAEDGAAIALQYAFDRMQGLIAPYDFYHVTMGKGALADISALQASFSRALLAAESRRVLGLNALYDGNRLDPRMADITNIPLQEPNHALIAALRTSEPAEFSDIFLQEYARQMPDMRKYPYCLILYAKAFLSALGRDLRNACGGSALSHEREREWMKNIESRLTESEVTACMARCAEDISHAMQSARPDIQSIQRVKQYVSEHYQQKITLDDAAREVYLSPAYLGILFKRETGENFTDYLTGVRMENAKALLRDIRLNVSQVADMVGYKDSHHFSKLFKRAVGISPMQYRKYFHEMKRGQEGKA